jgi:pimeloyl-ACP methyl ester carboxylesterase
MDKTVVIKKRHLAYSDVGHGPVIVFIHGWMASKKVYEEIVKDLSVSYRCISVDLPGFGKSDVFPKLTVEKIPDILNRFFTKLDIDKFYLVGNSLGGGISILFTDRYPEKVKKLVLVSPFVTFKQFSKTIYFLIRYVIPHVITRKIISPIFNLFRIGMEITFSRKFDRKVIAEIKKQRIKRRAVNAFRMVYQLASMDLDSKLRQIRTDTLVIYGTRDPLLSLLPIQPIFGVLNNIHLAIFENVKHYIFSFPTHDLAQKINLFFRDGKVQ